MKKGAFVLCCAAAALFAGCSNGNSGTGGDGITEFGTPDKTVISNNISSEDNAVMLQGFSWESCKSSSWWNVIESNAEEIGNDFEYVWFPPCSDSYSDQGYLPRKLYDFDTKYGTKEQLKSAIAAISPAKAIADVVINHRCGTTSWGDFTNPSFGTEKGVNYKAICSDDEGFEKEPDCMGKVPASMRGAEDTGKSYEPGRDLDHTNSDVQNGIIEFLGKLKDLGFCGWRYDFVKGYAGKYVGMYNKKTEPVFSVGEYWPTAGYSYLNPNAWGNAIKSWVAETASDGGQYSCAFDFALKGAINTVFGNKTTNAVNSHYNLLADESNLMISNPEAAVTFVDNHDTGSTQKHWYTDPADVGAAYVLILTHPGTPCVAWQHYFGTVSDSVCNETVSGTTQTLHDHIKYLIDLRKSLGITNVSERETLSKTPSLYAAKITGSAGEAVVSLGNTTYECPDGFSAVYSGTGWCIYVKDKAE